MAQSVQLEIPALLITLSTSKASILSNSSSTQQVRVTYHHPIIFKIELDLSLAVVYHCRHGENADRIFESIIFHLQEDFRVVAYELELMHVYRFHYCNYALAAEQP